MHGLHSVRGGPGVNFSTRSGTTILEVKRPNSSGSSFPFRVVTQPKPDSTTGQIQWGVVHPSSVFLDIGDAGPSTISGLLASNFTSTDSGWKTISATDVIYLQYDSTGFSIKTNGASPSYTVGSGAWTSGSWIEASGTPATWSVTRKVIATATITGTGTAKMLSLNQVMKANQLARPVSVLGRAGWSFFDVIS